MASFETAVFGNRGGSHQLLSSSLPTTDSALETLRFLVDRPAGHIGSEVSWWPYWGCQRVERWWVLWRGEEDQAAPRKNMVTARVVLVPMEQCATLQSVDELLATVGYAAPDRVGAGALSLTGSVVDCLANGKGPAVVPNLAAAPHLMRALWPRLWASARASLSVRTLFGVESLETVPSSSIVVVPAELKPRWRSQLLPQEDDSSDGPAARWFSGSVSPKMERMIAVNATHLPDNFNVLERVERIVERLERLQAGKGTLSDALVVVRTQEAFTHGFVLPTEDLEAVTAGLANLDRASVSEVRTASLVRLDAILEPSVVQSALARWVEAQLPTQPIEDALWILEQEAGGAHATWWRRGVAQGVDAGCRARGRSWAAAIWRWWLARPGSVSLIARRLDDTKETEEWLAKNPPDGVDDEVVGALAGVCREREWPTLLARSLGSERPLMGCVETLRKNIHMAEAGLDALLVNRSAGEIVDAAAASCWPPLVARAASYTVANPTLFSRVLGVSGLVPLLLRHFSVGGLFPAELVRADFLGEVFDGVLKGNKEYLSIADRIDERAGPFLLDHPECMRLLSCVRSEVIQGSVDEWWRRFLANGTAARPPSKLCEKALESSRTRIGGAPITLVISLLHLFPEIAEADFERWMSDLGFLWTEGDHQRLAALLVERNWRVAAKALRWSWKRELVLVAWYSRDLLSWFDRFWSPPDGVVQPRWKEPSTMSRKQMKILFLAANPLSSSRLALDEEARAIEEKVRDAKHRDLVAVKTRWAVRPQDLQQALLEDEPTVVHFSGHGGGAVGIVLHSADTADERLVAADALVDLFRVLKDGIRVVVLNACYSEVQASAIVKEIDFVVGLSDSIADDAARVFAAAFYRGLAFGRSVRNAFDLGINELRLMGLNQDDAIPRLLVRSTADANAAVLVGPAET